MFDVFLSYNSRDKLVVEQVNDLLAAEGLRTWFDKDIIIGGDVFITKIEDGLKNCRSVAILIGAEGFGRFQDQERIAAIKQSIDAGTRVIPVLLPGAGDAANDLPSFLAIRR